MKALRQRRQPTLIPERVAELARCARPTVTRMEAGTVLPRIHLFSSLLGVYGVTEEERAEALRLWEHASSDTTTIEHADHFTPKYQAFRRDEADAVRERTMDPVAIPGLLQTAAYASAVADGAALFNKQRPDGWELRAAVERQARQQLLRAPGSLELHALIDEAVIRRVVGGRAVMAEQLRYLLSAGSRENVTIQLVPFGAGAYGAMSGPVILLGFEDPEDQDLVYLEHAAGGESLEDEEDVAAFSDTFDQVSRDVALPPTHSAVLIGNVLSALEGR
ncbi:helix-turn-helix domain-containing protein [Solihabitans fulvus]|nr:helix-turn-helix transcriptional regulator [Solihabitans fulvus]